MPIIDHRENGERDECKSQRGNSFGKRSSQLRRKLSLRPDVFKPDPQANLTLRLAIWRRGLAVTAGQGLPIGHFIA